MALADFPTSYKDPQYAALDDATEQKLGLPPGMVQAVRTEGERTNADRVSSAGARTPYQVTPPTRKLVMEKYGIDPYLSPANASEVAGLLLKEGLDRNKGDAELAVREYHGGTDKANWGKQNDAYWARVGPALNTSKVSSLSDGFAQWMKDNPATPTTQPAKPATDEVGQKLQAGFANWLKGGDLIPDTTLPADRRPVTPSMPQAAPTQEPGVLDHVIGAAESAANLATGFVGGTIGMNVGAAKGITQSILDGSFGTPEAERMVERTAAEGAQALTYQPRTQSGQDQAAAVGEGMQQLIPVAAIAHTLPPMGGGVAPASVAARAGAEGLARDAANAVAMPAEAMGMVAPGAAGEAAAGAAAATGKAVSSGAAKVAELAKGVTTLPRRALERITGADSETSPTPGTMSSGGAAGTDMAAQRKATSGQLPVPVDDLLTKGMLSRDPAQMKFEVETAKLPEAGAPLRQRVNEINERLLDNFDAAIDQTGAEAPSLRITGAVVDKALVDRAKGAKAEVRSLYKAADAAGEMETPVALDSVIQHLNDAAPEAATAPLIGTARALAVKMGIAKDEGGTLVPTGKGISTDSLMNRVAANQGVSLKRAEAFRQAINRNTDFEPTNVRQATIIKGLIDQATDGMGGAMYRQARAARARYAQVFEDHAVIAKLLNNKRGTSDRQVAFEDIFKHSIKDGSLDDVRVVRRTLQNGGDDGKQAWRELQGATIRDIRDEATKSVALDSRGNRVMSPAALDKAIRNLDADGKLDFIFGKRGAQTLRDIRELAQIAKTVPPEAAINMSNTASTLLAGIGDIAGYGMGGVPVPIFTLGKLAREHIKNAKLRNRINDALNQQIDKKAPNNKRGAPPLHAPSRNIH